MFDFNDDVQRLQIRVATVADWHPELALPSVDTGTLLATAGDWLPMYIGRASAVQELRKIDMCAVIWGYWDMRTSRLLSVWLPLTCGCRVAAQRAYRLPQGGGCADSQGPSSGTASGSGRRLVSTRVGVRCFDGTAVSPGFKPVQLTQRYGGILAYHLFRSP